MCITHFQIFDWIFIKDYSFLSMSVHIVIYVSHYHFHIWIIFRELMKALKEILAQLMYRISHICLNYRCMGCVTGCDSEKVIDDSCSNLGWVCCVHFQRNTMNPSILHIHTSYGIYVLIRQPVYTKKLDSKTAWREIVFINWHAILKK